jgi:hypothetical protein
MSSEAKLAQEATLLPVREGAALRAVVAARRNRQGVAGGELLRCGEPPLRRHLHVFT